MPGGSLYTAAQLAASALAGDPRREESFETKPEYRAYQDEWFMTVTMGEHLIDPLIESFPIQRNGFRSYNQIYLRPSDLACVASTMCSPAASSPAAPRSRKAAVDHASSSGTRLSGARMKTRVSERRRPS